MIMGSSLRTFTASLDSMPMKPLAGLFLALACVLGIASTGCVFELAYGDPDLGSKPPVGSWLSPLRRRSGHCLSRFG